MTATANYLVFTRVWLPRPLEAAQVERFLSRLAGDPLSPWLVLETRATAEGIAHLIGVTRPQLSWLHQLLRDLFPGVALSTAPEVIPRPPCATAAELAFHPDGIALDSHDPVATTTGVLSALAARVATGEPLVVQCLLGPRRSGQPLRPETADPHQGAWSRLLRGTRPAAAESRRQLQNRLSRPGFLIALRVGVRTRPSVQRQRITDLAGALSTACGTGVRLTARHCRPTLLDNGRPPTRWRQRLAAHELTGLIAWPLGDGDLPGVPPLHPRLPLPTLTPGELHRVFATTALPGSRVPIGISATDALLHTVVLGPTGSGKSTALQHLIAADARAGRPVMVIDPKRQLIDDVLAACIPADRLDDVVVFDPADPQAPGFNPLDVGTRSPDVVVDALLAVFKAVFADGWGPRTEDIFLASLLTLARAGQRRSQPYTLLDLPMLLTDATFRRHAVGAAGQDAALGGFWSAYEDLTPAAQAAMIAAPMNKLRRYLLRSTVRAILGQPTPHLRLRDIFRHNKIVLVALNDALTGPLTAELLGSLLVAETWQATQERASETAPTARPATVVVDECHRFVHLPTSFADALSQSRSYGVGWTLAHQSRSQLPPALTEAIDANARNKLIFRLESATDATHMAKLAAGLDREDFERLPKYHAYARVLSDGESCGWCAVVTHAPPKPTGLADTIRRRSHALYGTAATADSQSARQTTAPPSTAVGRKRRTQTEHVAAEEAGE